MKKIAKVAILIAILELNQLATIAMMISVFPMNYKETELINKIEIIDYNICGRVQTTKRNNYHRM